MTILHVTTHLIEPVCSRVLRRLSSKINPIPARTNWLY
jgi:hypothetical protein